MVKFGKNKLKALNKLAKKQSTASAAGNAVSNKVLKKKINAEKKVTFQKEILIKDALHDTSLVKEVSKKNILLDNILKKTEKLKKKTKNDPDEFVNKSKLKPVKKQKQRQTIQISDTKLLLNLMKKK